MDWPLIGLANPGRSMLTVDGADHRRLRTLVAQALTVKRVERLRAGIEALTNASLEKLAALPAGQPVDLKAEFAYPLPMNVISELMGVDAADHPAAEGAVREVLLDADPAGGGPADDGGPRDALHEDRRRQAGEPGRRPHQRADRGLGER
ncbi:cytochrome P450 [Streptomyces badius]